MMKQARSHPDLVLSAASSVYVGRRRKNNEDNIFFDGKILDVNRLEEPFRHAFENKECFFSAFAVCDGMGGEAAGEQASYLGVNSFGQWCGSIYRRGISNWEEECCEFFRKANERVVHLSETAGGYPGCTCSVLVFNHGQAYFANAGDSRIYLYRNDCLSQLSTDHTLAQLNAQSGSRMHGGNALTRYLGMEDDDVDFQPSVGIPLDLCRDDLFLMCSDGLTDMLSDAEIQAIIKENEREPLSVITEKLMEAAMKAGGHDNCSIILIKSHEGREAASPSWDETADETASSASLKELLALAAISAFLLLGIAVNLYFLFHR